MTVQQHISLILLPEFALIAVAGIIDCLRLANQISGEPLYSWSLHSRSGTSERDR
jgi:transcriptional regulator GlxA family with amidase domain